MLWLRRCSRLPAAPALILTLLAGSWACVHSAGSADSEAAQAAITPKAPPPPGPRELADSACKREDAAECLHLGHILLDSDVEIDRHRGAALLDFQCLADFPEACAELAWFYARRTPPANADAGQYAMQACKLLEPMGCALLAALMESGRGRVPDPVAAGSFYELACRNGPHPACQALARWRIGHPDLDAVDTDFLLPMLDASCEAESAEDCALAAALYRLAEGVPSATSLARARLASACSLGLTAACSSTAPPPTPFPPDPVTLLDTARQRATAQGTGTKVELSQTRERLEDLCRESTLAACLLLADEAQDQRRRAAALYDDACSLGHLPSCGLLGTWLYTGDGVPRDRDRGKALIREACHGSVDAACDQLEALGLHP